MILVFISVIYIHSWLPTVLTRGLRMLVEVESVNFRYLVSVLQVASIRVSNMAAEPCKLPVKIYMAVYRFNARCTTLEIIRYIFGCFQFRKMLGFNQIVRPSF